MDIITPPLTLKCKWWGNDVHRASIEDQPRPQQKVRLLFPQHLSSTSIRSICRDVHSNRSTSFRGWLQQRPQERPLVRHKPRQQARQGGKVSWLFPMEVSTHK